MLFRKKKILKEFRKRIQLKPENMFEELCCDFLSNRTKSFLMLERKDLIFESKLDFLTEKEVKKNNKVMNKLFEDEITYYYAGIQLNYDYYIDEYMLSFLVFEDRIHFSHSCEDERRNIEEVIAINRFSNKIEFYEFINEKAQTNYGISL